MTRREEQWLVNQAQQDPRQFDALYMAYIDDIYRFIYYKTSHQATAEDLTAQVFMQALERLQQFHYQPGARFSSWLYRIAHNLIVDYYRKHKETVDIELAESVAAAETTSHIVDEHLQAEQVQCVLQMMSEDDRTILQLRLWQDKSYTDIAQIMQSNAVAIRARYSRAVKKFNALYAQHYGSTL
jgi:RNA polymerase sigma-70 factor (ECF subfamily)